MRVSRAGPPRASRHSLPWPGRPQPRSRGQNKSGRVERRGLGFNINILVWGLLPKQRKTWDRSDLGARMRMGTEQIGEFKTKVLASGLSLPLGREPGRVPSIFSSSGHHLPRGTGTPGSLLKRLWCGCRLDPSIQVESSPPRPPCLALQKDGSARPQQELLALQRGSKTVRQEDWAREGGGEGRKGGRARLSQAPGRVQASGSVLSGARPPPPPPPPPHTPPPPPRAPRAALLLGSDSVTPETSPGGLPWPLQGTCWMPSLPVHRLCLVLSSLPPSFATAIWLTPLHPSGHQVGSPRGNPDSL